MRRRCAVVLGVICAAVLLWSALISVAILAAHLAGTD